MCALQYVVVSYVCCSMCAMRVVCVVVCVCMYVYVCVGGPIEDKLY